MILRYADLGLLAVALPAFLLAGWPMPGYAVCAAVWLAQRAVQVAVERRAITLLGEGNRRGAMGLVGATTLGRVWLVALSVLLVGKLGEREDGLAAALLAALLVTVYFIGLAVAKLLEPEEAA